jgi:hypothetical protein
MEQKWIQVEKPGRNWELGMICGHLPWIWDRNLVITPAQGSTNKNLRFCGHMLSVPSSQLCHLNSENSCQQYVTKWARQAKTPLKRQLLWTPRKDKAELKSHMGIRKRRAGRNKKLKQTS